MKLIKKKNKWNPPSSYLLCNLKVCWQPFTSWKIERNGRLLEIDSIFFHLNIIKIKSFVKTWESEDLTNTCSQNDWQHCQSRCALQAEIFYLNSTECDPNIRSSARYYFQLHELWDYTHLSGRSARTPDILLIMSASYKLFTVKSFFVIFFKCQKHSLNAKQRHLIFSQAPPLF